MTFNANLVRAIHRQSGTMGRDRLSSTARAPTAGPNLAAASPVWPPRCVRWGSVRVRDLPSCRATAFGRKNSNGPDSGSAPCRCRLIGALPRRKSRMSLVTRTACASSPKRSFTGILAIRRWPDGRPCLRARRANLRKPVGARGRHKSGRSRSDVWHRFTRAPQIDVGWR
jgi:hypothetical protein